MELSGTRYSTAPRADAPGALHPLATATAIVALAMLASDGVLAAFAPGPYWIAGSHGGGVRYVYVWDAPPEHEPLANVEGTLTEGARVDLAAVDGAWCYVAGIGYPADGERQTVRGWVECAALSRVEVPADRRPAAPVDPFVVEAAA